MNILLASIQLSLPESLSVNSYIWAIVCFIIGYTLYFNLFSKENRKWMNIIWKIIPIKILSIIGIWILTAFLVIIIAKIGWVMNSLDDYSTVIDNVRYYLKVGILEEWMKLLLWLALSVIIIRNNKDDFTISKEIIFLKSVVLVAICFASYETFLYAVNNEFRGTESVIYTLLFRSTVSMSAHIIWVISFFKIFQILSSKNWSNNKNWSNIYSILGWFIVAVIIHAVFDICLTFDFYTNYLMFIYFVAGIKLLIEVVSQNIIEPNLECSYS